MSEIVEVIDSEQLGPSPSTGLKKRRFLISQQPLGSANRKSLQMNNINIAHLSTEINHVKETMHIFAAKLDTLEMKMNSVLEKCSEIFDKVISLHSSAALNEKIPTTTKQHVKSVLFNNVINTKAESCETPREENEQSYSVLTESSQIIKLNAETDYPNGCWLGNPLIVEERVRIKISQTELDSLNTHYSTPEKMALALMEALFSRETLACSNITGKGKHKKKQLNPLMIFGIFCHLKYKFNINDTDWARIKNNMDSKCRFFWSRRCKGLPLGGDKIIVQPEEIQVSDSPTKSSEGLVQTRYPCYSMYSVWDGKSQAKLVTVEGEDGESVYQLNTGELVKEIHQFEQFGDREVEMESDNLMYGTVLVSSGGNIMLGGDGICDEGTS